MKRNGVLVAGSANIDFVVKTDRFPGEGETVFGETFGMFPGGKGANQAVACAKLGARTYFVGKVGRDPFRDTLTASMRRSSVDLRHLTVHAQESTGMALITVDGSGQNEIVVVSGSNMKLLPKDIHRARQTFARVKVILLQLEIPVQTVARAAVLGRRLGATVILNPAPAKKLPASLLKAVDIITPNETEAEILTGIRVRTIEAVVLAGRKLLRAGVGKVIVTLGSRGAVLVTHETVHRYPPVRVKAVDTTAAGDTFNGALAFAIASNKTLDEAIPLANAMAAYSVTRMGAQSSMPGLKELRHFLNS
jgi:ribokinase